MIKEKLIVEDYPEGYNGYPFVTLIQHSEKNYLTVIDNYNDDNITAYVLDKCRPEGLDEATMIEQINKWHANNSNVPLSIFFSREGLTPKYSQLIRTFNIQNVSRIIGPLPKYEMNKVFKVKRRRKRTISSAIPVKRYP